ncbi:hypothetical protein B0T21DRAFT_372842 [Apiosordaria backusii]|uniref:Uncharacterized protein n=1 Tax=Apiosordaria backusii TaxID=314023 RepID=A0AA40E3R8_9PEZI|nr:hypothetical protein B0T21DRAFT_372842 [Apiosordaria backusii]
MLVYLMYGVGVVWWCVCACQGWVGVCVCVCEAAAGERRVLLTLLFFFWNASFLFFFFYMGETYATFGLPCLERLVHTVTHTRSFLLLLHILSIFLSRRVWDWGVVEWSSLGAVGKVGYWIAMGIGIGTNGLENVLFLFVVLSLGPLLSLFFFWW